MWNSCIASGAGNDADSGQANSVSASRAGDSNVPSTSDNLETEEQKVCFVYV